MIAISHNQRREPLDWTLLWALAGLMVLGVAFIYSACIAAESDSNHHWYQQNFIKQIIWYSIGVSAMVAAALIDYHTLARWSAVGYWAGILFLVAVLIPSIGTTHNWGARRWIDLGSFQMQPSEFAKLAFILGLANFIGRPADEMKRPRIFFSAIGMMALPFLLIMKEPDLGSALVFIPVGLVMLYIGGAPVKYMVLIGGVVGALIVLLLVDILYMPVNLQIRLEKYQRNRILVYFNRKFSDSAPRNATAAELQKLAIEQRNDSYNVKQALISVGSGGLMGKGWRQGTQNALGYLPRAVAHNDFIFSVIAEESGFVGSVVVITLYAVVLFTGIRIAGQARDRLGKLMAVGVVTLLFSHVFINIGMNIRLMPVTGVPLPLLSYGGSSVLCSLIAAGLLQNVHIHRRDY